MHKYADSRRVSRSVESVYIEIIWTESCRTHVRLLCKHCLLPLELDWNKFSYSLDLVEYDPGLKIRLHPDADDLRDAGSSKHTLGFLYEAGIARYDRFEWVCREYCYDVVGPSKICFNLCSTFFTYNINILLVFQKNSLDRFFTRGHFAQTYNPPGHRYLEYMDMNEKY